MIQRYEKKQCKLELSTIERGQFIGVNGSPFNSDEEFNKSLGIAIADSNVGEMTPVAVTGIALAISGGAISRGNAVYTDGGPVFQLNFSDPATADELQSVVGKALDTVTGAGEFVRVLLK